MSGTTNEKVPFRFIACPECNHQLCWVNPRLPSYCPECGRYILAKLRAGEGIHETREAWLRIVRDPPHDPGPMAYEYDRHVSAWFSHKVKQ